MALGSGDSDAFSYDPNTGRMTQYKYTVNGSSVTGNLTWNANGTMQKVAITDALNSANTQTCTYGYDDLARILNVNCGTGWGQTFTIGVFGNIQKTGSNGGTSFQPTYNSGTNQMTYLGGQTPTYDLNGNLTFDTYHHYTSDAENAVYSIDSTYLTHDALGRVVEIGPGGSNNTVVVYAPTGQKLSLINTSQTLIKGFVPLPGGGRAVVDSSGAVKYYRHPDWLGSSRLASTTSQTLYYDAAYAPYGESYAETGVLVQPEMESHRFR